MCELVRMKVVGCDGLDRLVLWGTIFPILEIEDDSQDQKDGGLNIHALMSVVAIELDYQPTYQDGHYGPI